MSLMILEGKAIANHFEHQITRNVRFSHPLHTESTSAPYLYGKDLLVVLF